MKEEIIGAFDATARVPDVNSKIDQHESRIEDLERKSIVFEVALRSKDR